MNERQVGAVRVTRIEEMLGLGFFARDFFPDFDEAVFAEQLPWLAPKFYDPDSGKMRSSNHCWVLRTGRHTILIDTCNGNHKNRPGIPRFHMLNTPWLKRLERAGLTPEEVDFVLCTHLHSDHIGWNTQLQDGRWVPTFPNAHYVMARREHDFWIEHAKAPGTAEVWKEAYKDSVLPVVEAGKAVFVDDGHQIDDCLTLNPAPGHTPGHIRIEMRSEGKLAVFSGDILHSPVQMPLWRWNSSFCEDPVRARQSRHDLLAFCAEERALLLPTHFAEPHAATVKVKGDGFMPVFEG